MSARAPATVVTVLAALAAAAVAVAAPDPPDESSGPATRLGPGGGDPFKVAVAKRKAGPYEVDIESRMNPGQTKSFWFRVRNTGNQANLQLSFDDAETSDSINYKTAWFKRGENISSEVEGDGHVFRIDPGQRKYFKARQRAEEAPGAVEACLAGQAFIPMVTSDLSAVVINGKTCSF